MDKDRPKFSKGYTFSFNNDEIVLVLNDGLYGPEIIRKYRGQIVTRFYSNGAVNMEVGERSVPTQLPYVWYYILVGDHKGWITEYRIEMVEDGE